MANNRRRNTTQEGTFVPSGLERHFQSFVMTIAAAAIIGLWNSVSDLKEGMSRLEERIIALKAENIELKTLSADRYTEGQARERARLVDARFEKIEQDIEKLKYDYLKGTTNYGLDRGR